MRTFLLLMCLPLGLAPAQGNKKEAPKDTFKVLQARPFGVEPGKTTRVTLRGLRLDAAKEVKLSPTGSVKLVKKTKIPVPNQQDPARVGDSEAEVELQLPADIAGDAVAVVVVTPTGESASHKVLLDRAPLVLEKEPNDGFKQAQLVSLGRTVAGEISRAQDVDVYRFEAKAGDKIVVEVMAARLGSPLDSFLTLYDGAGQVLTMNDDLPGSRDSKIEATLKKAGIYLVAVTDANDQGGAAYAYRLSLRKAN